jgi:ribose transport system substrate-binding protein
VTQLPHRGRPGVQRSIPAGLPTLLGSLLLCAALSGHGQGAVRPAAHHPASLTATSAALSMPEARQIVGQASQPGARWSGPQSGPAAQSGKTIAVLTEDLRNGGILGVAQGVREAAGAIGWTVGIFDAKGTPAGRAKAFAEALASKPDGLVLCGADALENKAALESFAERRVPVVGWHSGSKPGPMADGLVATNITTDPLEVARVTALAAVLQSGGQAGVVVFTDSRFEIAMAKADAMVQVIKACTGCTLLEVRDVAISDSAAKMPALTRDLLARHGPRWTHALAINDIYFDYAVPALTSAGLPRNRLSLLSAGDGSASAFLRIQAGTFQAGTVAEPLNLQGWQAVDELNRLFARQSVSGYMAPVHLVTTENLAFDGGKNLRYDPDNGYRDIYRRIWKP